MAKAAATGRNLSLVLRLFILLSCPGSSVQHHKHSVTCDGIIKADTTSGQTWCEGQCSVDGEPLLQYNDSKFVPLGDLGNSANGTKVWTDMIQKLEYLWKELRTMLAHTKKEITKINGQPTLQVTMLSQYEHGQIVGASWTFNISGKYSFIFNIMNGSCTLIDGETDVIMKTWKNDELFIKDLKIISTVDFRDWLKKLLKHQKEKPTAAPDVVQPSSIAIKTNISVLLIILTCLLLSLLL